MQRNAKEAVPGCNAGGTGDLSGHDYCYKIPAGSTTLKNWGGSAHGFGTLNLCQGDCDTDAHCAGSLKCFQRNAKEPIPGCTAGGAGDISGHDYCGNTASTTLLNLGGSAHTAGKLNRCQGDCDTDAQCASGNYCFQRNGKEAVPGCKAGGSGDTSGYDYCTGTLPAGSTTMKNFGGSAHIFGKINQCQGDCDTDAQCASGLKCMQRNAKEAVPGCNAGGTGDLSGHDYCYKIPAGSTTLMNFGGSAHTFGKLNLCQGDCDSNSQCASGYCFQRNTKEPVPGCNQGGAGDLTGHDYCGNRANTVLLNLGGSAHTLGKLNKCQGDCDSNKDCASGLKCFQRNGRTAVPGCKAGGSGDVSGYDYCY